MAKNKPANLDDFWRDAISQWERNSNELATQNMQSPEFGQAMTNLAIGSTGLQKLFAMMVGQSLAHMNLPNRTEILDISERLRAIEASLAQIQTALAKLTGEEAAAAPSKAKPARTKKPPARMPATTERAK
jgi:hypothetical protein